MTEFDDASQKPELYDIRRLPRFAAPNGKRPGIRKQNPFRVFSLALDRTLGNFAASVCYAASVKAQFDHAKLVVYFRNDRPYKTDILSVCPGIDEIIEMNGSDNLPLDVMDIAVEAPFSPPAHWYSRGWNSPHLIVTSSMAALRNFGVFEQTARFRFTDEESAIHEQRLRGLGVDPNRWFCVLHYREANYTYRNPEPFRDVDPQTFQDATDWIIRSLGGQVLRIGHPGMRPFRTQPGFIDLASFGDTDFKLQLYAISRARFVLASASGPGICGSCFGTPTGMCNDPVAHGVWNKQDAKMSNHIIAPDNRRISHELAVSREMYFTSAFKHLQKSGFRIAFQSTEEVKRLSNLMYDRTTDTPRWRDHWYTREQKTRPNEAPLPTDPIHRETFVDFPDLAPGDGVIDLPANP